MNDFDICYPHMLNFVHFAFQLVDFLLLKNEMFFKLAPI